MAVKHVLGRCPHGCCERVEELQRALSQDAHYVVFDDNGFSIEHLVECRPHMTECIVHRLMQRRAGPPVGGHGRYSVEVRQTGEGSTLVLDKVE